MAVEAATAFAIFGSLSFGTGWPMIGPLGKAADRTETVQPATVAHSAG